MEFLPHCILHQSVDIQGHNRLRAGCYTTRTERVGELIILHLIPQSATAAQTIRGVRHIDKERVPLCLHLCSKVGIFLIQHIFTISQKSHCFSMYSHRFVTSMQFSYELLYITIQFRLYHHPDRMPPISAHLGVLPSGIVVELLSNKLKVISMIGSVSSNSLLQSFNTTCA